MQANVEHNNLDLVYSSHNKDVKVTSAVSPLLPIDAHYPPLEVAVTVPCLRQSFISHCEIRRLNYRRIEFEALSECLSSVDRTDMFRNIDDVDDFSMHFCDVLCIWLNKNLSTA